MNASSRVLRVLLVEDSKLLAERLLELLADIPQVNVVGNVGSEADALAAVRTTAPDVLVLDLQLRQGTGFGVLRALQVLDKFPAVVILTNYSLPQYRTQAQMLGAQYFLDKASEFDRLPAVLSDIATA